ncbi:MAG: 50S ribosomal protein L1 [Candidatus Marinimicrobia bacterium]|nr:50S ribosomal protein L1 [Candidatus Neomarinimicrobiota bacterium]MCF7827462.1 50S ribosomal protein L1 [Candidatus Neomarinimicrobiota bacterium]MCF7882425.1 50S ribosomal protein L1 [Candidatus Neomarinimicrobiota bacterium]
MKRSKRYNQAVETFNRNEEYPVDKGVMLLKQSATANFDETVELSVNLGVDPKHADQIVRGTVTLPNGTGKDVKVLVLAKGPAATEAEEAGADYVGLDEYIEKIQEGWTEMDVVIATPDVMGQVGKLGRVLGPRGLMPNPKSGTVTTDVAKTVEEMKAGKIEFRVDRYGIIHSIIGKASFESPELVENVKAFIGTLLRMRPAAAKGQYLRKVTISSTMGPGIKLDRSSVVK